MQIFPCGIYNNLQTIPKIYFEPLVAGSWDNCPNDSNTAYRVFCLAKECPMKRINNVKLFLNLGFHFQGI